MCMSSKVSVGESIYVYHAKALVTTFSDTCINYLAITFVALDLNPGY